MGNADAEGMVITLAAARDLIDEKLASFNEKAAAESLPNMSPTAPYQTVKELGAPRSGLTNVVFSRLHRQIKGDSQWARRFPKKLYAHRKRTRYEQHEVNQIRKAVRIKKILKRT